MSKTKEFEDALDECLERLLVKHETMEQCIQHFPKHSDRLKPLLETALAARQTLTIQPRPGFKELARLQLSSVLREAGRQKGRSLFDWDWPPRWATAIAVLLVISLAGGGTIAAASGSMPDSPLYSVKRATEQVRLTFAFSEMDKAELHAKLADKRVAEIVYLADNDETDRIDMATENLNDHLAEIPALVSPSSTAGDVATAPSVSFAREPPEAGEESTPLPQEELKTAETASLAEREETSNKAGNEVDRRAKLKTTIENQASDNLARLRAVLEKAPESAKPALQRAIENSENGYKKAVESLK